jgi:hypothetical protein
MLDHQSLPDPPAAGLLHPHAVRVAELLANESWIHHRVETITFERDQVVREVKLEYSPGDQWDGESTYVPVGFARRGGAHSLRVQQKGNEVAALSEAESRRLAADVLVALARTAAPAAVRFWESRLVDHSLLLAVVPAGSARSTLRARYHETYRMTRGSRLPRRGASLPVAGFVDAPTSEIEVSVPGDVMITGATVRTGDATLWTSPARRVGTLRLLDTDLAEALDAGEEPSLHVDLAPRGQYTMRLVVLAAMLIVMGSAELARSLSTEQAFTGDGVIAALALISTGMAGDGDRLAGRLNAPYRMLIAAAAVILIGSSVLIQRI